MGNILRTQMLGSNNIGVYFKANNHFLFYPPQVRMKKKFDEMVETLTPKDTDPESFLTLKCTVNHSALLGSHICMNSKGIILPSIITEDEYEKFSQFLDDHTDMNLGILDSKANAFGNLICANDNGAIISPQLTNYQDEIKEILQVSEVAALDIANLDIPGSCCVTNNRGTLCHPLIHDRHVAAIERVLQTEVDVSTINCGAPYLQSGALANDWGAIFGNETTGPEVQRFSEILGLF